MPALDLRVFIIIDKVWLYKICEIAEGEKRRLEKENMSVYVDRPSGLTSTKDYIFSFIILDNKLHILSCFSFIILDNKLHILSCQFVNLIE